MKTCLLIILFIAASNAQVPDSWFQLFPAASPSERATQAMAYDSARSQVVLFGGNRFVALGDTWVWDGTNWTQKSPKTSPSARENSAMAYDSAHQQIVLFGGFDGNVDLADTWTWDGTNWKQQSPVNSPPARSSFAMAYDSARGQVVLFGGEAGLTILNDTWVWDGSNWTQKFPQTNASERGNQTMAYDAAHQQVVMFAGFDYMPTSLLNDTWVWDGSNWTQESPQNSPPARDYHAMAYDSTNSQIVMFGGEPSEVFQPGKSPTPGTPLTDTWLWDGSNWKQAHPTAKPLSRIAGAMAYDSVNNRTVLFGGGQLNIAPDTWLWYGGAPPPPPPPPVIVPSISSVTSASGFGGFAGVAPGSWIEIYGSNLAPDTRGWAGSDFSGDNAPTSLDGVSVSIGGQAAFVDYISPTQVNAQLPSAVFTTVATKGMFPLTVTSGGVTSAPVNLTVNATEPGLLASSTFKVGANQYVIAMLADGNYVLPAGSISGVNSRPAKPGETVVMYGIGFGSVTPSIPAGQIVTESNQLSGSLQISFGGAPAQLPYFGLAPNFVGLYQFNVVVPTVPDSDLVPLTFNLNGVPGTQTLFTSVHQ